MRRSKLEIYVDILRALAQHGTLRLTYIMYKANVNCSVLKEKLRFLVHHNLVDEQTVYDKRSRKMVVYNITERGLTVLRCSRELNDALKILEEVVNSSTSKYVTRWP